MCEIEVIRWRERGERCDTYLVSFALIDHRMHLVLLELVLVVVVTTTPLEILSPIFSLVFVVHIQL